MQGKSADNGTWDCPSMVRLMDVAEFGIQDEGARDVVAHMLECEDCAVEYAALVRDRSVAERILDAARRSDSLRNGSQLPAEPMHRLALAASSSETQASETITCYRCEGAVTLSIYRMGTGYELELLNDARCIYVQDDMRGWHRREGVGISLAGELLRFDIQYVDGREEYGFLVLPELDEGVSAAEVSLEGLSTGAITGVDCRLAGPDELADAAIVCGWYDRLLRRSAKQAMRSYVREHESTIAPAVRDAIQSGSTE